MLKIKHSLKMTGALLLTTALLMSACSNSGKNDSGNNVSGSKGSDIEITEISLNTLSYGTEFPDSNNAIVKEFEKRTNTKLKIDWVPVATSSDKLNVLYASGNLPDVTYADGLDGQQIRSMIDQGVFWDLTDMLKDYPNLSNPMLDDMWKYAKVDGKNYSVPRYYPTHGGGIFPMVRQDWLDKLNLPLPTTLDEFKNTLIAFKENKLAGEGTVPYAASQAYMNFLYPLFNDTQGAWKLRDGKLYPIITEDASRDALVWIKEAYDAGLFPADFVILKFSQITDAVQSGKAGGAGFSMNNSLIQTAEAKKIYPEADLVPLPYLEGPSGNKFAPSGVPFYGHFLIPKKVSEQKVRKILEFLDYGYSPEGNELANYGIKGVHFNEENGIKVPTEQFNIDIVGEGFQYIFLKLDDEQVLGDATITTPEIFERNKGILQERKKVVVTNPSQGILSEASTKFMPDINKKVDDMRTKVILGQESLESYDKFIAALKEDTNLKAVTEEMNKLYGEKAAN